MTNTLLDAVNGVLKKVGMIAGDAGVLTSLTSSSRQRAIDLAVQIIGEGVDELFTHTSVDKPLGQGESFITLATGQRSYSLATASLRIIFPMVDRVNTNFIRDFPGGYNQILLWDPRQTFTGLPQYASISPKDGTLFIDRTPTTNENGRVYYYQYEKDQTLSLATDVLPFPAEITRAMVPVWAQMWKREIRKEFDQDVFTVNLGRAARLLTKKEPRTSYSPRMRGGGIF